MASTSPRTPNSRGDPSNISACSPAASVAWSISLDVVTAAAVNRKAAALIATTSASIFLILRRSSLQCTSSLRAGLSSSRRCSACVCTSRRVANSCSRSALTTASTSSAICLASGSSAGLHATAASIATFRWTTFLSLASFCSSSSRIPSASCCTSSSTCCAVRSSGVDPARVRGCTNFLNSRSLSSSLALTSATFSSTSFLRG
mmetsp:Transcript_127928/g.292265  ORF Transcript_127928/g.292265 Transcript_127928/m.292265 type:complete len:204 (+) Transcript_127928:356-967(+)